MFTIQLYSNFRKRKNSTRRPQGSGTTKTIVLKDETSTDNPIFILNFNNQNPTSYNYLYCLEFAAWYYIDDWVWDGRFWQAVCVKDVMATYKNDITSSYCYVLRSASQSDSHVPDNFYSPSTDAHVIESSTAWGLPQNFLGGGTFVLGVAGYPSTGGVSAAGLKYYFMDAAGLGNLLQFIFRGLSVNWADLDSMDIMAISVKALVNPMQYIRSCVWLPFGASSSLVETVAFGWWNSNVSAGIMDDHIVTHWWNVDVPKPPHDRGDWQMLAPFAEYTIRIPGFGLFPLPPEKVFNADYLSVYITADWVTGRATCAVTNASTGGTILLANAQIGVPISLNSVAQGDASGVLSGMMQIAGGAVAVATENPAGVMGIANGAINTAGSMFRPILSSTGTQGGFSDVASSIRVQCTYYTPLSEDNTNNGRPLCAVKHLSDLSGYCQVLSGIIATTANEREKAEIKSIMEGGFYLE